jgi:sugar lactone lactonase YvrE
LTRSATAAPALPTGAGERTLSAWVKCDAPATPGGRTLLDLFDGSAAPASEHFTLLGVSAATGAAAFSQAQWTVSTPAGINCTTPVTDGPVATAYLGAVYDTKPDQFGNIFFTDRSSNRIRVLYTTGAKAGTVATIAGTGSSGGTDGPASSATFYNPFGLVFDSTFENIYVGDYKTYRIRRINLANMTVSTVAGSTTGFSDGVATSSKLAAPYYLAIDRNNNIYIGDDTPNFRIRVLNVTSGMLSTLVGTGTSSSIDGLISSGSVTVSTPRGLCFDSSQRFLTWVDYNANKVRRADLVAGTVSTLVGPSGASAATAATKDGFGAAAQISSSGYGIACDPVTGNVFTADWGTRKVRRVTPTGMVTTIAGTGVTTSAGADGPALTTAAFYSSGPTGLNFDAQGNLWAGDPSGCKIRKLTPPAAPQTSVTAPVCGDGLWHAVAVTLTAQANNSVATLYVDGAQQAQLLSASPWTAQNAATALGVGGSPTSAENLAGAISNVQIFGRALSPAEVVALARPPLPDIANTIVTPPQSNATATSFVYSCALGYIGPTATVQRNADGSWSSSGVLNCAICGPTQFTTLGGTVCIDTPTLPVAPNAVASPAVAGVNIVNYVFSCAQPGFTGVTQNFTYSAVTNSFALTGQLACTACAATQFSLPTTASSGASGFVCRQCADFDANLVLLPGGDKSIGGAPNPCTCAANTFSNGAASLFAIRCTACPDGATSPQGSTTCACSANFVTSYSGTGSLICTCPAGFSQTGVGAAAICGALPTQTATMTSSATQTATGSASATSTQTSTSSLTSTGSLTGTATATS